MSDLISRSALVEKLIKRFKEIDRGRAWRNEHMPIHDAIRLDEIENLQSIALDIESVDAVPVVRCRECVYFRDAHVRTNDGQMKSYDEFPPEAFGRLGTGDVTSDYGINVGSQCLVDCNRGYGEDKTVFRSANDFCSRGVRKMDGGAEG